MTNEKVLTYFSAFSGIGGFELGIHQAVASRQESGGASHDSTDAEREVLRAQQPRCVGYSEIDKYASKIYATHFPDHTNYGDITSINADALPDFDLFVGGFPCQAFSIAGKRAGFNDTRGTLFFDIARILKAKRPRNFLLENVKGLLSHDDGRTIKTIVSTLVELGYCVEWQVLNSKDFGVPQNRERIFFIGHLGDESRVQVFPITDADQACVDSRTIGKEVGNIAQTLTARQFANWGGNYVEVGTYRTHKDGRGFRKIKSGIAPTIPARAREDGSGQPVVRIKEATKIGYAEATVGDSINLSVPDSKTRRGRVGRGIAQTLDTGMQQHTLDMVGGVRRLTPMECERLQGFPDNWTDAISDTQRYKCLGNAVTVNVIQALCERLFYAY